MQLSYDYFYSLLPRVFNNIAKGYMAARDMQQKEAWERTRALIVALAAPYRRKDDNRTATEFYPLPWDDQKGLKHKEKDHKKLHLEKLKRWAEIDKN